MQVVGIQLLAILDGIAPMDKDVSGYLKKSGGIMAGHSWVEDTESLVDAANANEVSPLSSVDTRAAINSSINDVDVEYNITDVGVGARHIYTLYY